MPVKLCHTSLRFWFFLSYLITTVSLHSKCFVSLVKSFYISETGLNYTLPRGDIHNDYIIVPRFTYNSRIPERDSQLSWKKWTLFWFWLLYYRRVWQTKMGVLRLGKPFGEIFMFIGFDYWSSSWEQPLGNLPNRQNYIEIEGTNYQFSFNVVKEGLSK